MDQPPLGGQRKHSANLAVIGVPPPITNIQIGTENLKPYVQTITTSLVWKFNWYGR